MKDEGFDIEYSPLEELKSLPDGSAGMVVFRKPAEGIGHVVAVDNQGVIDPEDNPSAYQSLSSFCEIFKIEGWRHYYRSFLKVRRATVQPPSSAEGSRDAEP